MALWYALADIKWPWSWGRGGPWFSFLFPLEFPLLQAESKSQMFGLSSNICFNMLSSSIYSLSLVFQMVLNFWVLNLNLEIHSWQKHSYQQNLACYFRRLTDPLTSVPGASSHEAACRIHSLHRQSLKALKMAEKMRALRPCLLSSSLVDHQFLEGRNYI